MSAKYLIVVEHQLFSLYRELFVKHLALLLAFPSVTYLLGLVFFVANLEMDFLEEPFDQMAFMLQKYLLSFNSLDKEFIDLARSFDKLAQLQITI
jgi:hypothetical protein